MASTLPSAVDLQGPHQHYPLAFFLSVSSVVFSGSILVEDSPHIECEDGNFFSRRSSTLRDTQLEV